MVKIKIVLTASVMLINIILFSQNQKKTINYSKKPYWIDMIKDPKVNYFEAMKAYDVFWENRKKPLEENDVIGQSKNVSSKRNFLSRWFKTKEERDEEDIKKYTLDVKKFNHWKLKVEPYVQADGSILDADARLKLWQDQQ
ncbi:MAG: hypothetical protein K9H41_04465 [Bacteroidia bacterium]|nr:hypothetical protein [Bacteroidia bacterium]